MRFRFPPPAENPTILMQPASPPTTPMDEAAREPRPISAFGRLRRWWQRLAARVGASHPGTASDLDTVRLHGELHELFEECRVQRGGEVSARQRAARIAQIYRASSRPQRAAILAQIAREFAPEPQELKLAISDLQFAASDSELSRAEARLRRALDAPRARFLAQFNLLADGVKFLVDLRADVLDFLPDRPELEALAVELEGLLASWFDPGFLELRRITWQSPALVLEKLMNYEAVHPIESWSDMRNRLDTDRRCYAFFHPRLIDEPLIFVEIALLRGMPESVQGLLDVAAPVQDPAAADTAIFYSISNTQRGLRGISLGNLLLKRVIEALRRDLPRLSVFATFSPIPGFRKWLERALADGEALLEPGEASRIEAALGASPPSNPLAAALARPDWPEDARLAEALRAPLERLCARYLVREKAGSQPLDPVAAFHLHNGARIERLFWLADTSERGLRQSCGMMASYRYELDEVDENHERFVASGHIAASRRVQRLLD
jgi:malonyl-CoA decarboxylase